MLVLHRKPHERVLLFVPPSETGFTIIVEVCDSGRNHARVGFDADKEVHILREEVYIRDQEAQAQYEEGAAPAND